MKTVEDANAAIEKLNGTQIGGREIKVNITEKPIAQVDLSVLQAEDTQFIDSQHKVYVGNLAKTVTSNTLKNSFPRRNGKERQGFTSPRDLQIRGFGFVSFSSEEEVEAAISSFNNAVLEGQQIRGVHDDLQAYKMQQLTTTHRNSCHPKPSDMDVESLHEGFLAAIMVEEGGVAPIRSAIALLAETEDEISEAKAKSHSSSSSSIHKAVEEQPKQIEEAAPDEGGKRIAASPYAKKLAKELKVDLGTVVGTGPIGRIVAEDVEAAAAPKAGTVAASPANPAPVAPGIELGTVVPFTTMQGAVSRNMVESLSVPTVRVGYTITTNALDALDSNSFTYNIASISVSLAIDGGLITPVLQDAGKVDIYTLSRKWKELVDKARAKQLQPHEYNTGTFTLSNLGMFGVDRFDAILPPGTGAIMAVGASQPPVVSSKDGRIGMKNQMQEMKILQRLCLSSSQHLLLYFKNLQVNVTVDHRVIYGADLAAFLQTLAKIVEDPIDLTF
ncbi:Dihydrolipoyllysine-residue acetyltransferase component 4 of pyruvate dehydrogenase complex [Hibiscus syriacus]|uniref:Dihydrolipoyllysine-residue acetyltransferase component 4 of pyruvate dehydrogenase complex n=1 Tax=Hibiscus syriacus TaxID=106335 RepID=A0A6A2YY35_HIBSY|nr:Dihydrolipoyllysine-residue acetyltransferase component 4 of pyruvate dehydrogenase complex [Hibiscus syriacus]